MSRRVQFGLKCHHRQSSSRVPAVPQINRPFWQCIGQSSFEPHPYAKMGGRVAGLGLYKAGHAGSCSKHFTYSHVERKRNSVLLLLRNPTLQQTPVRIWNGYLRVGEFSISSAFRTVDSSAQTCWPLQWWSVLTSFNLVQLCMSCVINGIQVTEGWGGMLKKSPQSTLHDF